MTIRSTIRERRSGFGMLQHWHNLFQVELLPPRDKIFLCQV